MSRRYPRRHRQWLVTRAPRKGTLIIAVILYILGLFGLTGFAKIPDPYPTYAFAIAGGLLILGSLMRDL